jgi:hypothetical protein
LYFPTANLRLLFVDSIVAAEICGRKKMLGVQDDHLRLLLCFGSPISLRK